MTKEDTKIVKGVAILLMMFHHLFGFKSWYFEGNDYISIFPITIWENTIEQNIANFGRICIALFLFCTGYGFWKIFSTDNINQNIRLTIKHLKTFIIKYWKVLTIVILFYMFILKKTISFRTIFLMYCGYISGINPTWWFVKTYICILLLLPAIYRILKSNIKSNFYIDLLKIFLISAFCEHIYQKIVGLSILGNLPNTIYMVPFNAIRENVSSVLMGMYCAKYLIFENIKKNVKSKFIYFLIPLIIFYLRYLNSNRIGYDYVFIVGIIAVILQLNVSRKVLKLFGEYSTEIWLIHMMLIIWEEMQYIIFYPKLSILIYIFYIMLNLIIAIGIRKLWDIIDKVYLKVIKIKKEKFLRI